MYSLYFPYKNTMCFSFFISLYGFIVQVMRITMEGIKLVRLKLKPKNLLEFVWFVVQLMV